MAKSKSKSKRKVSAATKTAAANKLLRKMVEIAAEDWKDAKDSGITLPASVRRTLRRHKCNPRDQTMVSALTSELGIHGGNATAKLWKDGILPRPTPEEAKKPLPERPPPKKKPRQDWFGCFLQPVSNVGVKR